MRSRRATAAVLRGAVAGAGGASGLLRPGIVHRLDMGTSGLLVVAKREAAQRALSAQFKARTVRYWRALEGGLEIRGAPASSSNCERCQAHVRWSSASPPLVSAPHHNHWASTWASHQRGGAHAQLRC